MWRKLRVGDAPTLLTRMSAGPWSASAASRNASTDDGSDMSATYPRTDSPAAEEAAATTSLSRAQNATRAPWPANARTTAAPLPAVPPVTTARRPVRSMSTGLSPLPEVRDHRGAPLADRLEARRLRDGAHLDQAHDLVGPRVDEALDVLDRVRRIAVRVVGVVDGRGVGAVRDVGLVQPGDQALTRVLDLGDVVGVRGVEGRR